MTKEELWEEIRFEIASMKRLKESPEEEILVGSGNKDGNILFIGDDSGLYDGEKLNISVGSSGEFLIKLCDLAGILPNDYFITTLTKRKIKFRDLFDDEKVLLKELLHMQIALIQPKIVVIFGKSPAEEILDREIDMGKERGVVVEWKGKIKLLVTYDVNYIKQVRENTGKKSKAALDFWKDLQTIKLEMEKINEQQ